MEFMGNLMGNEVVRIVVFMFVFFVPLIEFLARVEHYKVYKAMPKCNIAPERYREFWKQNLMAGRKCAYATFMCPLLVFSVALNIGVLLIDTWYICIGASMTAVYATFMCGYWLRINNYFYAGIRKEFKAEMDMALEYIRKERVRMLKSELAVLEKKAVLA